MKRLAAVIVALMASLAMAGSASAAVETVALSVDVSPVKGSFYREAPKSANLEVSARVDVPAGTPTVTPTKNIKITFPKGLTMNPNNKVTPVCTDAMLSQTSQLSVPATVMAACGDSVVGTGRAILYAARNSQAVLTSPILVAFNAGVDSKTGNPKLKIWGYAFQTNYGILMETELQKNGLMDIPVPPLSYDSATKDFQLQFPGAPLVQPESGVSTQGKDPNFVRAVCPADGKLTSSAVFDLQWISITTGQPMGPAESVPTAPYTDDCTGLAGKAKMGVKVKGPRAVKNGRKGVFKVTIKNTGTATAKNVVVTTKGGKGKGGNIAPGKSKTVKVKATVSGKKGRKATVRFTAKAGNVKASGAAKVTVK